MLFFLASERCTCCPTTSRQTQQIERRREDGGERRPGAHAGRAAEPKPNAKGFQPDEATMVFNTIWEMLTRPDPVKSGSSSASAQADLL
jgi:hypothetical protein